MDKFIIASLVIFIIGLFFLGQNNIDPTQKEIQTLDYALNNTKVVAGKGLPYPQISNGFHKLTDGLIKPLNNISEILPNHSSEIDIVGNQNDPNSTKRYYLPDYYRKDRLCENDIDSEELRPFVLDETKSENSWTEINVSDHPKYYTSDIKNELTNIGSFFDKNNQYHDKISANTDVLISDRCYKDKMGNFICEDKTRLQNIPPSLISDKRKCGFLSGIGDYRSKEDTNLSVERTTGESQAVWSYGDDRTINGNTFYGNIYPSKQINETYSRPILKSTCDDCPFI